MKASLCTALLVAGFLTLLAPRRALAAGADDAGLSGATGNEAGAPAMPATDAGTSDDAGTDAGTNSNSGGVPLRCDGGLCDTTTGGTPCSFRGRIGTDGRAPVAIALLLAAIRIGRRTRRATRRAR
jgi:hypothetical protein